MIQLTIQVGNKKIGGEFTDLFAIKEFIDQITQTKKEKQLNRLEIALEQAKRLKKSDALTAKEAKAYVSSFL
jgi:hypothetical protein